MFLATSKRGSGKQKRHDDSTGYNIGKANMTL